MLIVITINCILGDLNARVAESQVLDYNLVQSYPFINEKRASKDQLLNAHGTKVLELCENIGGIILNGRQIGDVNGEFTFCGAMGFSVIDYGICSENFLNFVGKFSVACKPFSDHMLLCLELDLVAVEDPKTTSSNTNSKLRWNSAKSDIYVRNLNQLTTTQVIDANSSVNAQIEALCTIIRQANGPPQPKTCFKPRSFWYDWQCERARKKMLRYLNLCRKFGTAWHKTKYSEVRASYLQLCDAKKKSAENQIILKLGSVSNSKDWWRLANSMK